MKRFWGDAPLPIQQSALPTWQSALSNCLLQNPAITFAGMCKSPKKCFKTLLKNTFADPCKTVCKPLQNLLQTPAKPFANSCKTFCKILQNLFQKSAKPTKNEQKWGFAKSCKTLCKNPPMPLQNPPMPRNFQPRNYKFPAQKLEISSPDTGNIQPR